MEAETKNNGGIVWLVGAGPGDPGLITVKGLHAIQKADVIVYDSLANPQLLEEAHPDCELIYAGKRAGQHSMKQDETTALLVKLGLEGRKVCRLKGGDPFVFGRGGEEALALRENGVYFEIIPGITAATGVTAYAGIPITHRECSSSARIATGHEKMDKNSCVVSWENAGSSDETLVVYMGVQNLADIAERLIAFGRPPDTPAALIANGTLPSQRTVVSTLERIADEVKQARLGPPALLVVGPVVRLREGLNWFETRPLFGKTLVVTRSRKQASELAICLETLGAEVIQAPTIQIETRSGFKEMLTAARHLREFDWVVFTSVNGVDAFLESLQLEHLDGRTFGNTKIAAIGPSTAERLGRAFLDVDLLPERYVGEALLEAFKAIDLSGKRILIPRSEAARPLVCDGLREMGAEVTEVSAYRTVCEKQLPERLLERLDDGQVDLVTFTSSSTVTNFIQLLKQNGREELVGKINGASIGPITTGTAEENGVRIVTEATEYTIPGLVKSITDYYKKLRKL